MHCFRSLAEQINKQKNTLHLTFNLTEKNEQLSPEMTGNRHSFPCLLDQLSQQVTITPFSAYSIWKGSACCWWGGVPFCALFKIRSSHFLTNITQHFQVFGFLQADANNISVRCPWHVCVLASPSLSLDVIVSPPAAGIPNIWILPDKEQTMTGLQILYYTSNSL